MSESAIHSGLDSESQPKVGDGGIGEIGKAIRREVNRKLREAYQL